jgi:putative drug exporter of the RND superfamily
MSRLGKIAEIPAGSWTKWIVVGFWAILLVILLPLSAKLQGAEKNDAKQWLPGNAESTKVVDLQEPSSRPTSTPRSSSMSAPRA